MAKQRTRPEMTIRRSRRRLIRQREHLAQLDLFQPMKDETKAAIVKLESKIALATGELELACRRA
jgi:hypothetical protein